MGSTGEFGGQPRSCEIFGTDAKSAHVCY
jgi:hypothetical protein